jgi:hypothetical protein
MYESKIFVLADRALNGIVRQIQDDQWALEMPEEFQTRQSDHRPTLREVIDYHAYDDAWMPDILAGRTMDRVGVDKFARDLLGNDPKAGFATIMELACTAAEAMDDPERVLHFSYGDYPAKEGLWHVISFRGLRTHDLAKFIGVNGQLADELVTAMWEAFYPRAEDWRAMGVFGPEVAVPADAPLQDRLLGLTGRQPDGSYS